MLNNNENLAPFGGQSGQQLDNGPEVSGRGGHGYNGKWIHASLARIRGQETTPMIDLEHRPHTA